MRVLSVLVPLLVLAVTAPARPAAQEHATDRGSLILGGSAGASTIKQGTPAVRTTSILFFPQAQYFVAPGLALGGSLAVHHNRSGDDSTTSWGVGPQGSYYFGGDERRLIPYLTAQAFYNGGTYAEWAWGAAAGAAFMLTPSVGLDTSLYYRDPFAGIAVGLTAFVF